MREIPRAIAEQHDQEVAAWGEATKQASERNVEPQNTNVASPQGMTDASSQIGVSSVADMPVSTLDDVPQSSPPPSDEAMRDVSSQSQTWEPICTGTVIDAELRENGASVTIKGYNGSVYSAYIPYVPVIRLGVAVELGVKRETQDGRTVQVADIVSTEE